MGKKPEAEKDAIAQAMVRKRWDKTPKKKRVEIARALARARWGKRNA